MDWSETRKTVLLIVVAALLMLATQFNLFSPVGLRLVQEKAAMYWAAYGRFVLSGFLALAALLIGGWLYRRYAQAAYHRAIIERVSQGPTVQLLPRADARPVQPDKVRIWQRLADALPHDEHISFEIAGNESRVGFYLHGSSEGVVAALTQFRAEWPGLFRKKADDPAQNKDWAIWWVELAPNAYDRPVQAAADDPLRAILIELNGVLGHGRGMVQVIARRNFGAREMIGRQAFAARDEEIPSKGVRALRQQDARRLEERAQEIYLDATIRAVGLADTHERAQAIARGLARAIAASFSGLNPVRPVAQGRDAARVIWRTPGRMMAWAAGDLAALAHLAGSDLIALAPRMDTAPARYLPADPDMRFDPARHKTAFLTR